MVTNVQESLTKVSSSATLHPDVGFPFLLPFFFRAPKDMRDEGRRRRRHTVVPGEPLADHNKGSPEVFDQQPDASSMVFYLPLNKFFLLSFSHFSSLWRARAWKKKEKTKLHQSIFSSARDVRRRRQDPKKTRPFFRSASASSPLWSGSRILLN